jgi:hypothetical protein
MALQPPDVDVQDGKPMLPKEEGEGVGGWISKMVKSNKGEPNGSGSGRYQKIGQDDEDD